MKEIREVVDRYLKEKDTDYAIMITGAWGCGKTYYITKYLKDYIGGKKCCCGKVKDKYKPIYISLYGITEVSDINMKVLEELFPMLKLKISLLFRHGFSSFISSKGIDRKTQKEVWKFKGINSNCVLIFDDIERVNCNKVDIKELLGVINQYVEHDHIKTILICNDEKSDPEFNEFKEKTIRYSIKFQRSFCDAFEAIISERKKNEYIIFLENHKESIISIFQYGKCGNLRTLKFFIDAFEDIYNKVQSDKYKNEINESLLVSFLLYSIEYKNGNESTKLRELEKLHHYTDYLFDNKEKKQDYIYELYEKYNRIRYDYKFYPVINKYITDGFLDDYEFNNLIKEIYNNIVNYTETPEGKLLRLFEDWKMIDDDQFKNYISELIKYVKEVKYSIQALTVLYHQLLVIEYYGIEGFKIDKNIDDIFRKSAYERVHQDGFNLYIENDIYQLSRSLFREQVKKRYDSYVDYIGEINRELRIIEEQNLIDNYMTALKAGNSDKIAEYSNSANFQFLLEHLDVNEVFEIIKTSKMDVVRALLSGFYTRFPDKVSGIAISPKEMAFIDNMKNMMKQYIVHLEVKKVSSIWCYILLNKLDAIIEQNVSV